MQLVRNEADIGNDTTAPPSPSIPERMHQLFRKLFFLIPIGIIGNVLFYLMTADRQVLASVLNFSPIFFAIAMLLSIVPWFTGSLRLLMWSRFLGNSIEFPAVFKVVIGSELGAAVSPPLIGGSAVKIGMLMRQGFTGGTALSLSVLENIEDTFFFLVMVPLALTITSSWDLPQVGTVLAGLRNPALWTLLAGICVCLGATFLLMKRKSSDAKPQLTGLAALKGKLEDTYSNFTATYHRIAREGKSIFVVTMALTSLQWFCRYSIISLLLASMGIPVRPILFMVLQVFVFALMTLVPTPGAAGGAEVMFSLVYRSFLPAGTIGLVTAGWRFLTFYFLLILAAALSILFGMQPRAETHPADEQGAVPQRGHRLSEEIVLRED
ncbi:MAG TPA: lysylphosphatidylglycerol synthase transmembrane domain-containing protein [Nitrospirota bacterium]|nr:lysylphosphatidylglycerol synthase transmembrane domain-containing protein [Nitrospirota bacterium]